MPVSSSALVWESGRRDRHISLQTDGTHPDFRPRRPEREGVGYNENANCEHKSLLPPDSRLTDYMVL